MDTEQSYLAEIADDPDNDLLRLMFADWLDSSDPVRAEFIREQCWAAQQSPFNVKRISMEYRWPQVIKQHQKRWAREFQWAQRIEFGGGVVDTLAADAELVLRYSDRIQERLPLRSLQINRANQLDELASQPWLSRVRGMKFAESGDLSQARLASMLHHPHWRVQALGFSADSLSLSTMDILANAPRHLGLDQLDIRHTELHNQSLTWLSLDQRWLLSY